MLETPATTRPNLKRAAAVARYTTLLLLIAMFLATHLPLPFTMTSPLPLPYGDKVLHAIAYMALALSSLISWELTSGLLQPQHYFAVWLLGTLYGAFDEVTQIPVGRTPDGTDWLSDILGLVLGLTLFRITRPWLDRFHSVP